MDETFQQEQEHLTQVHAKLVQIEDELAQAMRADLDAALEDNQNMLDELAVDYGNGVNLETYIELEAMHQVIDSYNQALDIRAQRLAKARLLLHQPYFAKVTLQFNKNAEPRDIYIGAAGMTDENRRHFIIDWRSPVAETYYNQENGHTSYQADGRIIEADLLLRRQFDIDGATLKSYFDTTVAIQDPLLLASLKRERSDKLRAITATIQKEQNAVIRHDDVPTLLVAGIAGSGKTSVLLQRIAYLLYRHRDDLRPDDVYLITPNDVFARYIENVLPDMGERNPQTYTWDTLAARLGAQGRAAATNPDGDTLRTIDEHLEDLVIEQRDVCDIMIDDERVVAAGQAFSAVKKYHDRIPAGTRLAALVEEELVERIEQRAKRLSHEDVAQDACMALTTDEMFRIFGCQLNPQSEEELIEFTLRYLRDRYRAAVDAVRDGGWLRIDRVGMRLLGKQSLDETEYLYLKMALTGAGERHARYVMVDEVQDYTAAQLMVLARFFPNAHFLLLGDENQAIRPHTATFAQIRDVFSRMHGEVSECQLMTSYRSAPAITALFQSLMPPDQGALVESVQQEGEPPRVQAFEAEDQWEAALHEAVTQAEGADGLTAVIAADAYQLKRIQAALAKTSAVAVDGHGVLPTSGVVLLTLTLAKGLEFDRVIIPDAQAKVYGDDVVARHRLYTAISRATHQVTILANGPLTPLLA